MNIGSPCAKFHHCSALVSMDLMWRQVAEFCLGQNFKEVCGPSALAEALPGVCFQDYRDCCELSQGDQRVVCVLHRGLASEWPEVVSRKIRSGRFRILFVNDVFTVVCSSRLPYATCLERPGRTTIRAYRQLLGALRTRSTGAPAPQVCQSNVDKYQVDRIVSSLVGTGAWDGIATPNTSQSGEYLRDFQLMRTNIKALAWRLEQLDAPTDILQPKTFIDALLEDAPTFALESKICTSADIYSAWHRSLAKCLRADNYKLRKIWEWTYTLKALQVAGKLHRDSAGLGFGCGTEPLASCFANFADRVMVTDAPIDVIDGKGWSDTAQHTASLEDAKHEWLASRSDLDRVLEFSYVDMNHIPESLHNCYDFVWSSCALEHLGSKMKGLQFIVNSSRCLRPGGVGIHTTEYDLSGTSVIDEWETVLFNNTDLLDVLPGLVVDAERSFPGLKLRLLPFNLTRGTAFLDGYVDIPPYSYHANLNSGFSGKRISSSGSSSELLLPHEYPYPQINLSVDGYPSTSVAIVVERLA